MVPPPRHLRLLVKTVEELLLNCAFGAEVNMTVPLHAYCRSLLDPTAFGIRLCQSTGWICLVCGGAGRPGSAVCRSALVRWRLQVEPGAGVGRDRSAGRTGQGRRVVGNTSLLAFPSSLSLSLYIYIYGNSQQAFPMGIPEGLWLGATPLELPLRFVLIRLFVCK